MPITQIPFQDPVAPPEKPQPEQLGLYDQRDWETAYRELDERVPHLLIQLQDDLTRSRWREALWISIIVHLVLAIIVVMWVPIIQKYLPWRSVMVVPVKPTKDKDFTFLTLPPDAQKITRPPNTNIISDKNRIATTRHPELEPKDHKKVLATPPPGAPGLRGPRAPQPAPSQPATAQSQAPPQQQPQQVAPRPQFDSSQTAQLQAPKSDNVFKKYTEGMTAGDAIHQAEQGVAANRMGGGGQDGDYGLDTKARGRQYGALEILSDAQGVDFGPYLQRVLQEVKEHWYAAIPESAEMKKGKLQIEFAITKDGSVAGMQLSLSSGDNALDRAAWSGIQGSNPFPPLPSEFHGNYLALRFRFYYNPSKADLE